MRSLTAWWNHNVYQIQQTEIELAVILLWCIWQNRNEVVWQGKCKQATKIYHSALTYHSQWLMTAPISVYHLHSTHTETRHWHKPLDKY